MSSHQKVNLAGLLIALGIIYGDIGTSPLYVLNAITSGKVITEELIVGALSCIIWTLTLQTTIKYVILTLQADNRGEGGVFSLYALVRRRRKWLVIPAMIGGAALLADGMITPPISVTSAIEGLKQVPAFSDISQVTIVYIVLGILSLLFFIQQFGTAFIGRSFGPVMTLWFIMLALLGVFHIADDLSVFKAINPYYAIHLLATYPNGFYILGGVFLCTTGAEALYSDLGHCGKWNIRYSWIFVKTCLILNYLGQGAWLLENYSGQKITAGLLETGFNPFYGVMPHWFLYFGIAIATAAAIIASQALISGSFTLISEAMRLNLWPKFKINYPTEARGQLFIPAINTMLFLGCIGIVLYFKKASNMEAAYGLAITLCMIATSILFANFLVLRRTRPVLIYLYLAVYLSIELSFLWANMEKFTHGGYVTLIMGGLLFFVMYDWFRARRIKNRYVEFVKLDQYVPKIQELSNDKSVPKYATHLVYLTSADIVKEIEHKIMYSILFKKPKRADIYWFVHVDTLDDPYTSEYSVTHIIPNDIIRVDFRLGFRVQPRIDLLFRKVVEDLVANREVNVTSRYESLGRNNIAGDFQFIVMEKYLSQDNELSFMEKLVMRFHFFLKRISLSEEKSFGLDPGKVVIEKFPLIVSPVEIKVSRVHHE
ncbi:KUP/HAK/KT family potassium transporter [Flavihumibacter stibioxidans]|uniref:Probable potassium transport system protein Kup n=1 Tax=Flavihumibacter stibioxidans TaxID=1834163 RepID=A0ABR7M9V9_9BACT|nr:KUP/HAK/KT family potassium transporter [Flavihumibacter stibioxidans]MBC6491500.1 potassium transporter Kup [Flavihumibacter stibioxidans]